MALPILKGIADDKFNAAKIMISLFDWGKRRKCWLPALSPFPTTFSKALFQGR